MLRRCAGPRPRSCAAERAAGRVLGFPGAALTCVLWAQPDFPLEGAASRSCASAGFPAYSPEHLDKAEPSGNPNTCLCPCVLASGERQLAKCGVGFCPELVGCPASCQSQDRKPQMLGRGECALSQR